MEECTIAKPAAWVLARQRTAPRVLHACARTLALGALGAVVIYLVLSLQERALQQLTASLTSAVASTLTWTLTSSASQQTSTLTAVMLQQQRTGVQAMLAATHEQLRPIEAEIKAINLRLGEGAKQSTADIGDRDTGLCSRLASIFDRPPPAITLPQGGQALKPASDAYVNFTLERAAATSGHGSRNFFIYKRADAASKTTAKQEAGEAYLIEGVLDQLYHFAKENRLRPEEVFFVDLGSGQGACSLAAAAHGFRVIAFEPLKVNHGALRLSLCANPGMGERVTLFSKGLGNTTAQCTLYTVYGDAAGLEFIQCGQFQDSMGREALPLSKVDIVRLDEALGPLLPELRGRVGAVRVDARGAENLVVLGGPRFFREAAPPYVAAGCYDALSHDPAGNTAAELVTQMHELGYGVYSDTWEEVHASALSTNPCRESALLHFKLRSGA